MARQRALGVYVDSPIFGGVQDAEFARPSKLFFAAVRQRKVQAVSSALVVRQLDAAPLPVITLFREILRLAEVVEVEPPAGARTRSMLRSPRFTVAVQS